MTLEYHRPDSLEEALQLLQQARPLGGGSVLTPNRRGLQAVIDLTRLGLDRIQVGQQQIEIGAAARLQSVLGVELPEALREAVRLQAGWNLRNQATLAGAVVASDGRSPLVAVLLAMGASLHLEPGSQTVELDAYLDQRPPDRLITMIRLPAVEQLAYEQVARSPADRPQVCVAAALDGGALRVALGGFGGRPLLIGEGWEPDGGAPGRAAEAAAQAYADADDVWASGEYRAAAARALARRVVAQVADA